MTASFLQEEGMPDLYARQFRAIVVEQVRSGRNEAEVAASLAR
jgi:hypothetical protein